MSPSHPIPQQQSDFLAKVDALLPNGADLVTERHQRASGVSLTLICLKGRAATHTVQAVREWSTELSPMPGGQPLWHAALSLLRVPPALECSSPALVVDALRNGYVAIFHDDQTDPLVAPTTLDRLFGTPEDAPVSPVVRRLLTWGRVLTALAGVTLIAAFVAVSSYHHTLMPSPFLVAMAVGRSNLPFPIIGEIFLVSLLGDAFLTAALRTGGRKLIVPALAVNVLTLMAMMQVGVLSGLSGVAGVVDSALRATLPNMALRQLVRLWRYFFILAAAGLGVYGMALLLFLMMAYIAEERVLQHPIRLAPTVVSR